jgi:hypothetical protein
VHYLSIADTALSLISNVASAVINSV